MRLDPAGWPFIGGAVALALILGATGVWIVAIPVVLLFTGFSAKLRAWAERLGRRWYFSYAIYFIAFCLIYLLLLSPLTLLIGLCAPDV